MLIHLKFNVTDPSSISSLDKPHNVIIKDKNYGCGAKAVIHIADGDRKTNINDCHMIKFIETEKGEIEAAGCQFSDIFKYLEMSKGDHKLFNVKKSYTKCSDADIDYDVQSIKYMLDL